MLTKLEYLKKAFAANKIENKSWYFSCFAIPLLRDDVNWEKKNWLDIVTKPDGLYFVDIKDNTIKTWVDNKQLTKISDYVKDEPLFKFQDIIQVDPSWGPFITSKFETKLGNLIINALCLYPAFKNKLGYVDGQIKVSTIEKMIAEKVVSDKDAKETDISVSEMIDCFDRLGFLTNLANIINIASTKKAITPAPDLAKKKQELLKQYEGQLSDPVKLVEFEQALIKIDNDYLADDPAAKNIFNKKSKNARRKMYMIFGDTMDFEKVTYAKTIESSLLEGVSTDEEDFPKYMNDLRIGSFARGSSTQLGGYTYKILQRSLSSLSISPIECNTKRGLKRVINDYNAPKLLNRYVALNGKWTLIDSIDTAKKLIGKEIVIRSSMYCTSPKNTICYKCMNEVYKDIPSGVTNIASELSGVLLSLFMQLTHGKTNESTTIQMKDLVT